MKSKNLIGKIEENVLLNSTGGKFCPHTLAEIVFPNNHVEKFPLCHLCDLPPLRAVLDYCDGRMTPRKLARARRALAVSGEKFPNEPAEQRIAAVCAAFGCTIEDLLQTSGKAVENSSFDRQT